MADRRSDNKGQLSPFTPMLERGFDALIRECMFCLPGKVTAYDAETQLAQVEPGIQRVVSGKPVTIAVINNVPVQFAGTNEWFIAHEIKPGTEGILHFSQRAIDTWVEQGGPVEPHDLRKLSEEDAFFVPGVRSRKNFIPDLPNDGILMGNYSGTVNLHLTKDGIAGKGDTSIEGNLSVNGDVESSGDVKASGDVVADKDGSAISLLQHVHPGVESGPSTTGQPQ